MNKKKYVEMITGYVKTLNTYREEFDLIIDSLAQIMEMRDKNMAEWKAAGYKQVIEYTNKANATNVSKSPYYLNNLQYNEQILKYMEALGLTPRSAARLGIQLTQEEDALNSFLDGFDE